MTNHLGSPIKRLLVVDENGNCYLSEATPNDGIVSLSPADSQSAAFTQHLQPLFLANQPERPASMSEADQDGVFGLKRDRSYRNVSPYQVRPRYATPNNSPTVSPVQYSGLMERSLRELVEQLQNNRMPPRSYVAIVESSPEVELGTPSARQEESFHVIVGKW